MFSDQGRARANLLRYVQYRRFAKGVGDTGRGKKEINNASAFCWVSKFSTRLYHTVRKHRVSRLSSVTRRSTHAPLPIYTIHGRICFAPFFFWAFAFFYLLARSLTCSLDAEFICPWQMSRQWHDRRRDIVGFMALLSRQCHGMTGQMA